MSHRSDIDKQLAELEALIGHNKTEAATTENLEESASRTPSWITVLGVAAVVDLAARFFVPSSDSFVRLFEAVVFLGAGVVLLIPVIRKRDLTRIRRKIHFWLAAALGLGAVRSGMWGLGIPVEYANLTIFLLGIAGLTAFYLVRRKAKPGR